MDYEIRDFSLKIIVLIKNSGLVVYLKHQKDLPDGQVSNCKKQTILINLMSINYEFLTDRC